MDTSISLGVGGYFLIRSSSFMDWFYYAYGDTLHGLVPRIYRHSKRECVSFNIDSTDQFDPASRTFTYIPTIIRWQHWNHSSPNTHWEYIDCTDLSFRACSPYTISIEKKRTSFKQYRHTLFQQCSDFLSIICDYGNVCFPRLILAWPFGSHLYLDYSYFDIFYYQLCVRPFSGKTTEIFLWRYGQFKFDDYCTKFSSCLGYSCHRFSKSTSHCFDSGHRAFDWIAYTCHCVPSTAFHKNEWKVKGNYHMTWVNFIKNDRLLNIYRF